MNSQLLIGILSLEVLILAVLGLLVFLYKGNKKKKNEHNAISRLIKKINKEKSVRQENTEDLNELPTLDKGSLDTLFEEIHKTESNLYKQIVKIFLEKEVSCLTSIDTHIKALSAPYWEALKELSSNSAGSADGSNSELEQLRRGIDVAMSEKDRLAGHLGEVLETLDKVSAEYSQMFNNLEDKDELMVSKQKMIDFFLQAIRSQEKDASSLQESDEQMTDLNIESI